MSLDRVFVRFCGDKLNQLSTRIVDCLERLSPEQVWARGGDKQNAVGNLVLHLCGNVRQWVVSAIGGAPDVRDRDSEFAARSGMQAAELALLLRSTVSQGVAVIEGLAAERLLETVQIQGYRVTVLEAVMHVVEHFSQHTGQIVFATKLLTGEDLGYYAHLSGETHSESTP
jgi:uncharacterized damage-inducible protein DinB